LFRKEKYSSGMDLSKKYGVTVKNFIHAYHIARIAAAIARIEMQEIMQKFDRKLSLAS